ncbi:MAG: DUF1837 domain-containing protein [Christensenellaceae bacterium]|nr:DUF1837 domain-containing protein [Christensenellaceae bacterium]
MGVLTKTLKDAGFDDIFTEVEHTESLGLINPHELRMFRLDVVNNAFSFGAMHNFLISNIGRYVFSRAKMEQFRIENDLEAVGAKALGLLCRAAKMDESWIGEELGDILLYVFLEQILDAPKLFSKIELLNYGDTALSGGCVHLLPIDEDSATPSYQMVFGKSHIIGDLRDAADNAFESLVAIRDNAVRELQVVESTVFTQSFAPETAEQLKAIIVPSKRKVDVDKAFGVFLGYSLGLDASSYSNADFRAELARKMDTDIKARVAYIAEKIKDAGMDTHSFYFYILPFNDADTERTSIMATLLEGGA